VFWCFHLVVSHFKLVIWCLISAVSCHIPSPVSVVVVIIVDVGVVVVVIVIVVVVVVVVSAAAAAECDILCYSQSQLVLHIHSAHRITCSGSVVRMSGGISCTEDLGVVVDDHLGKSLASLPVFVKIDGIFDIVWFNISLGSGNECQHFSLKKSGSGLCSSRRMAA